VGIVGVTVLTYGEIGATGVGMLGFTVPGLTTGVGVFYLTETGVAKSYVSLKEDYLPSG
jgi:hypothetical protein